MDVAWGCDQCGCVWFCCGCGNCGQHTLVPAWASCSQVDCLQNKEKSGMQLGVYV